MASVTTDSVQQDAASKGCKMLFLPECFSFLGLTQFEADQHVAVLGGFQETGPDEQHLYNCHVVLNAAGETVAAYRKIHLFDVDVPNGPVLMESRTTAPGDQLVACDSPIGRLGLTVCYDLRFPEVYQQLAFELGAHVLLVPSAFTKPTGAAHWEVLLRARAIETQCYVIAAAQAGRHSEKRESYGHSIIVDPWGTVVARLEDPQATGIAVTAIDLDALAQTRIKMPIAEHRRRGHQRYRTAPDEEHV